MNTLVQVGAAQTYFKQDSDVQSTSTNSLQGVSHFGNESNPYDLYFKLGIFFKFFIMHILYFFCLGPLIIIISPIVGYTVLYNQGFVGCQSVAFGQALHLSGYSLAYDILKNSKGARSKSLSLITFIASVLRAFIPTFYRLYLVYHNKENITIFTSRPYIVALLIFINIYFFWLNQFILGITLSDINAKIYCFKQIAYLISPRKISSFLAKKIYPTLNIFDPIPLKTWRNLRKVMNEYGRGYVTRASLNISLVMIAYTFVISILVLVGVVSTYKDPLLLILLEYESLLFFRIFVQIMIGTAFLNDQYQTHRYLLTKNKDIIADFHRLTYLYAGGDPIEPENLIYKEGLRLFKEEFGEENFEEKVVKRSETLITMIEDATEALEFEEKSEPLNVMGIAVSYGMLKGIFFGAASSYLLLYKL